MNNNTIIQLENVSKDYHRGVETVHAVQHANFNISKGEYVAIVGHSGSGKTTLMNIIGCLDRPTSGSVIIDGVHIEKSSEKELTELRKQKIGFVFQQFFLIPTLTVTQNVALPGLFTKQNRLNDAQKLLDLVGLSKRTDHFPNQLSGGEMQRVAIARSLVNNPSILLADEPTGNLDSHNAEIIINLFERLNKQGVTVVMVTHNPDLVKRCSRTVHIEDGIVK